MIGGFCSPYKKPSDHDTVMKNNNLTQSHKNLNGLNSSAQITNNL